MNRLFADMVNANTPKFNPNIMNGLAGLYVPNACEWLNSIFRSASKSFPKGLRYEGYEVCTPYEEFFETTKARNNSKRTFDLAESDLFLVKFKFSFEDLDGKVEPLPDRYMYLPFVGEADIFKLGGTLYHVTGVLSNKVISPNMNSIFVQLIRDRLTFRHIGHSVMVNDQRESFNVVWSGIYRKPSKENSAPQTTKAYSSIVHYLFAKYGFTETFRKYVGFIPKVGHYKPGYQQTVGTILCRSSYFGTRSKPNTYMGQFYKPSDLYIEIPEQYWNTNTAAFVAGFFYVVDHFPERFQDDRIDSVFLWSVLLGHIIFSGVYSEAKLFEDIREHFSSLDDYLDIIVQDKLKEIGWYVDNFYDLIAKITSEFPNLLLGSQIDANNMFNKNIEILYYMLSEIAFKIFRVNYKLHKAESKKPLTKQIVIKMFNKLMTPRSIFNLTKDKRIVETVAYCGDHKYPKLTSKITDQESGSAKNTGRSNKGGGKSKRVVLNESNHIHSSMVEAGSVLFLSKANPMPNTRINPYVNIDIKTGTLIPNPKFKDILENLQKMLTQTNSYSIDDFVEDENIDKLENEEQEEEIEELEVDDYDFSSEPDVEED